MLHRLLPILLTFLFSVVSSATFAQEWQTDDISGLSEQELIEAQTAYIKGLEAFENSDYQLALDLLSTAYLKLSGHAGVNYALADAYLQIGDLSNAAYYGKQATNLEPENKWYRLKLASIYRSAGRNQATIEELKAALTYHPRATDVLYELAQTYASHRKPLQSNRIYRRLLKHTGPDINIHLQIMRNFEGLGMRDSVLTQLQIISELDPDNLSTMQLISNYYLEMGKAGEAKSILKKALKKNERDPKTLIKLADIFVGEAKWDSVGTLLTSVITDPIIQADAKLTVAQYLLSRYQQEPSNTQLKQETQDLLDQFAREEPEFPQAHVLAASFYAASQDNEKALQALAKTNTLMPSNDTAWRQRLQLLLMEGRYREAMEIGAQAAEHIPQDPFILYFWGNAYLAEGFNAEAAEKLNSASVLPARKPLKSAIYSSLGDALSGTKRWEEAFEAYENALALDPQNDVVLNNYAYFLSLQARELDKAEAMVLKALEIDPDNASYLDTAGWVYYHQGEYEKARKYIQASIDTGQASAEVLEHMGDVMDKLNQPQNAQNWWQKALQKDSSRTYLKEKVLGSP